MEQLVNDGHYLEINEIVDFYSQTICDTAEQFDAYTNFSHFNLPDMRLVAADHECELALRESLSLTFGPDRGSEALFPIYVRHGFMVCGRLFKMT